MNDLFFSTLEKLKTADVKIFPTTNPQQINLFDFDPSPIVEFNGFRNPLDFGNHLRSFYQKFKSSCDDFIGHRDNTPVSKQIGLDILEHELNEFKFIYFPNGSCESIFGRVNLKSKEQIEPTFFSTIKSKILKFIEVQFQTLLIIEKFIKHRIRHLKKFFISELNPKCSKAGFEIPIVPSEKVSMQLDLFPDGANKTNLQWGKDKVQFLELLTALYESKSVMAINGSKLTKKNFFKIMMWMFNINIQNIASSLNSAKNRKEAESPYLVDLANVFKMYCEKTDQ